MAFDPISAGFSLFDTVINNWQANERQNDAQAFSAEQFAKRYQTTTADMKAAGLNPMLAYSQGGGNAPTSAAASAAGSNLGGNYVQSKIASAQEANLAAQTRLTNAQANVTEQTGIEAAKASISNLLSQSGLNLEMQGQVIATTDKIAEEIKNLQSTRDQVHALISNLQEQNKLLQKQGISEVQRAALLGAQARVASAEARIQGFNIDAIIQSGGIGRLAREVKPVSDIASDWLNVGKWIDKFVPQRRNPTSTTNRSTGTNYDRDGNPTGGFSRESSTISR